MKNMCVCMTPKEKKKAEAFLHEISAQLSRTPLNLSAGDEEIPPELAPEI
jgi:hypothetical protein